MHGSNRPLTEADIVTAIDAWVAPFQHVDFNKLPPGERPVWHLKTTNTVPGEAYLAEIRYAQSLGYRVVSTLKLVEGERLTDAAQQPAMVARIAAHASALCDHTACPDVLSIDNEPDIPPHSMGWPDYSLTLDSIAEGLIAAKAAHGMNIALPCIGLYGDWEHFGGPIVASLGVDMLEFDVWLFHTYKHPPSFQVVYELEQTARNKTGHSTLEVMATETAIDFVKEGESPSGQPWVQDERGGLYFAAQVAASVLSGIEPCHFLLINVNTGILYQSRRTHRQDVAEWMGVSLFADGFVLDAERSTVTLDTFSLVTSNGEIDRTLTGRYLPLDAVSSAKRAMLMAHPDLTIAELEADPAIATEGAAVAAQFASSAIPALPAGATLLHELSHTDSGGAISWLTIYEQPGD